jgi:hypothetical protein
MGKLGKSEFVQMRRLLEVFQVDDVTAGVRDAIDRSVIGFDAVMHLVLCSDRPPDSSGIATYSQTGAQFGYAKGGAPP